jgi:hypothetical protein
MVFFFTVCFLAAQERGDTGLYISPTTGGTPEAKKFFDDNIAMEIAAANYKIVYTPKEASYFINLKVSDEEDPDTGETYHYFTITVVRASDNFQVIEFSWEYLELDEMYQWNLYIVYNALANVSLRGAPEAPAAPPRRDPVLHLGVRAGPAFSGYFLQASPGYATSLSLSVSGEAGLTTELRLFPFLGIQMEALATYDVFSAMKVTTQDGRQEISSDKFTTMSFLFPFMIKAPLVFEKFDLSFYAGSYFALFPLAGEKNDGTGGSPHFRIDPPLGIITGLELGFPLGPGALFTDIRYSKDFGMTAAQDGSGPWYLRDRIILGFGYKFGFFERKSRSKAAKANPADTDNPAPEDSEEAP